jgi:hypothetical protein
VTPVAGTPVPTQPSSTRPVVTQATGVPSGAAFSDTFASSASGLPASGYQNGEYRIKLNAQDAAILAYPNKAVRNAEGELYQVDARRVGGASDVGSGLLVRALDKNNYLLFVVYNDGAYALYAKVNGSLQAIVAPETSSAIKSSGSNRLQVLAEGTDFALAVNGTVVKKITLDGVWTEGGFGIVAVGSDTAAAEVAFKDYAVFLK